MESNYEKAKKAIIARQKERLANSWYNSDEQLKKDREFFLANVCDKSKPLSLVNKEDALKEYNKYTITTEFSKIMKDGTNRWYWTIRDKKATKVGYILGLPSREQKQDNTGKLRNNAWLGVFDFMELNNEMIAG